jgi:phage head maturation protease
MKDLQITDNQIAGAAAVMGNLDRQGDVLYPGCWRSALRDFRSAGFVAIGHDWAALPVAMPLEAAERGGELVCKAEFHSTPEGQSARQVCMERMQRGLSVGLSVGFMPDYDGGVHYFESGKALLQHAEQSGAPMDLFDAAGIARCKGQCRGISRIAEFYEFSIVPVPANPKAVATAVKSIATVREFEEFLRDAGFSRKQAVAIALHGFQQRDASEDNDPDDADAVASAIERERRLRDLIRRGRIALAVARGAYLNG